MGAPQLSVSDLCSELIRYNSSVLGGQERDVADRVADYLCEMKLEPQILEAAPRRSNVITRIEGTDPHAPALLVHIHLDVVPADAAGWSVDPFAGEIRDGYVWGRGAVDMKNMAAMTLTALRSLLRTSWRPRRDIVLAFLADEELGGTLGAKWLVESHPDLFAGCTDAIGEAGGFSYTTPAGQRAYIIQTAEKGISWLQLVARSPGGHGALQTDHNAVAIVAEAVSRLQAHTFDVKTSQSASSLITASDHWFPGMRFEERIQAMGSLKRMLAPVLRNTYTPTGLRAGVQHNVIPDRAEAFVDGRVVPGHDLAFHQDISALIGDLVEIFEVFSSPAREDPFDGLTADAITGALHAEDPEATIVPTCLPISTDAKHFSRLGIRCFGFTPMRLPVDFNFPAMFHGTDERVPVEALEFGERVLRRFFIAC